MTTSTVFLPSAVSPWPIVMFDTPVCRRSFTNSAGLPEISTSILLIPGTRTGW